MLALLGAGVQAKRLGNNYVVVASQKPLHLAINDVELYSVINVSAGADGSKPDDTVRDSLAIAFFVALVMRWLSV